ncbi:MAG: hypothetical protein K8H89_00220 [Flavobacteriales bacterium]|jgi:hypothetical protein|nr:hypothetical protein [Flavobacteriales bacterium]MCB0759853.1 hypothetical protein [Flavobacteriales bacterium]
MRIKSLVVLLPILSLLSCGYERDGALIADTQRPTRLVGINERAAGPGPDVLAFDIAQRTCAMYVAVRSRAFDETPAFGRDIDADMIHWNMCTGGTMVACATAPSANGDLVQVGIPWPYPPPPRH